MGEYTCRWNLVKEGKENMKKVIVSSKNPVKIEATKDAFYAMFPNEIFEFEGISVPSGVADQPMTDEETFQGATNRVENAFKEYPDANYWVGLEGGVEIFHNHMLASAWMVIKGSTSHDTYKVGRARTGSFSLPEKIRELIEQGIELGIADDMVFKRSNSKQATGSVGILTNDTVTRQSYYVEALKLALIPFLKSNEDLY